MFGIALYGKCARLQGLAENYLQAAVLRSCETIPLEVPVEVPMHGQTLRISKNGCVYGFPHVLSTTPSVFHAEVLAASWEGMRGEFAFEYTSFSDVYLLVDVVRFLNNFYSWRRSRNQRLLCHRFAAWFHWIRCSLLYWLSARMDKYVMEVYTLSHDVTRLPPALPGASSRKYARVTPDAAWELLTTAASAGATAQMASRIRHGDADMGADASLAPCWGHIHQLLHDERSQLAFAGVLYR